MILLIGRQRQKQHRNPRGFTPPPDEHRSCAQRWGEHRSAGFTPLHPESPSLQTGDEWQIEKRSLEKPRPEGRGVTGFTLLEILLVVVIIAIIVTIATPQFRKTLTTIQLANTTQDIAQLMRFLRVKASTEKCIYQLKFDLAGGKYSAQKVISGKSSIYDKSRDIPEGINLALTINPINFYSDGSIDNAAVYLFKGKEEFYKDIEKAINDEFDLGKVQTIAHTEYIYTITTQPSIGRVEVRMPK